MTAFATQEKLNTIDEYLEMEEQSIEKHEYYNGKITTMPGGTFTHNMIAASITGALINVLYDREQFQVCNSDMKIFISRIKTFVYPDAVVICENPEYYQKRDDIITNPILVVEVVSPSTARYDRTLKFHHYKSLPSFKEYVIIEQDFPWVMASFKTGENTWNDLEATQLDQSIFLRSINCSIDLKRIYRNIKFEEPPK